MEKVRIDAVDYEVQKTGMLVFDGCQCRGRIEFEKKVIMIDGDIGNEQSRYQTLWHEIVHGIIHERALDYSETSEETFVDEMAKGMVQLIRDNPELFTFQFKS